ncbi:MAG: hypothetical protein CMD83_06335 [Gammaproteobacteria bacterium]|nr:hypothetical protein [Gammaproteobacteria bacterium]
MSTAERDACIAINSAMTRLMRQIRRVDERQGVGRARLSALAVLHFGGACSLTELANAEMVSRATMHHVVAGLEGDRLVTRTTDPADARRHIVTLTRKGRRIITNAQAARINYLEGLLAEQAGSDTHTRTETPTAEELAITAQTMLKLRDAAARAAT